MLVMNIIDSVSNEVSSVFSQTIPTMDLLLSLLVAIAFVQRIHIETKQK